jgi:hypothetical protein
LPAAPRLDRSSREPRWIVEVETPIKADRSSFPIASRARTPRPANTTRSSRAWAAGDRLLRRHGQRQLPKSLKPCGRFLGGFGFHLQTKVSKATCESSRLLGLEAGGAARE